MKQILIYTSEICKTAREFEIEREKIKTQMSEPKASNDLLAQFREDIDAKYDDNKTSKFSKKHLILRKLSTWSQSLSAHGIPRLLKSNHKSVKCLWMIFICLSITYCALNLYRLLKAYANFDYVTHSEMITEVPTLFPSITICSINGLTTKNAENLIKDVFTNEFKLDIEHNNLTGKDFMTKLDIANKLARFHSYVAEFGDDNKRKMLGFSLSHTLLDCIYNDNPCGEGDFVWFYSIEHGNCYTFNSGTDKNGKLVHRIKTSTRSGILNGLRLSFFLSVSENKYSSKFETGLKLFIHNNSVAPMSTEGIDLKRSVNMNVVLKKSFFYRQPEPYSDCKDLTTLESGNEVFDLIKSSTLTYRQEDCFDLCLQYDIIQKCQCYALEYYPKLFKTKTPCLNSSQLACYTKLYAKFIVADVKEKCAFMCPLECNSMTYDHSLSMSDLATEQLYAILKSDEYYQRKYFKNETNLTVTSFGERYMSLNIYFGELKYLVMTQSIKMTFEDLLSSIGGLLGLLVGMSFLSLIEVVEIIIEILFILFKK